MKKWLANQHVLLGVTEHNTFIVASAAEPYFCFEGASEAEVIGQAKRALAFWARARKEAQAEETAK